ncbi:YlzJ-like family protein [Caldicoprobacter algeriensis]|uniref:YlzJ-like family protein n=1 Tax=Caldicoprobacter algeriensis TaxID=699281 RepID=UPI00207AFDC3|nr:YlzJ-like family protein [Caldicoprobacter algeriensis]MCM8900797.1 YlzJ-like family protein [Caldicoprobacter algeriensis]
MILHTIVPLQFIFGDFTAQTRPGFRIIEWNNVKLEVLPAGQQRYQINRILSTNPFDYLNPRLQPGTIIQLEPKI